MILFQNKRTSQWFEEQMKNYEGRSIEILHITSKGPQVFCDGSLAGFVKLLAGPTGSMFQNCCPD